MWESEAQDGLMACWVCSSPGLVPNSCAIARIQDAPIIAVIMYLESPQHFPLPSVSGEQEHTPDSVHRQGIAHCSDCPISANPSSGTWEILVSVLRPKPQSWTKAWLPWPWCPEGKGPTWPFIYQQNALGESWVHEGSAGVWTHFYPPP